MAASQRVKQLIREAVTRADDITAWAAALKLSNASGGQVTQATSKSTGVTLSTRSGQITMHNAALADVTNVTFTVTNTEVAVGDTVTVNHASAGTLGAYLVSAHTIADGSFKITVRNISGGSLGEAIVLNFNVIKGAVA